MDRQMINANVPSGLSPERATNDLVKLIRKLRWIGLQEEAHQLEATLSRFPPEARATVLGGPSSTD